MKRFIWAGAALLACCCQHATAQTILPQVPAARPGVLPSSQPIQRQLGAPVIELTADADQPKQKEKEKDKPKQPKETKPSPPPVTPPASNDFEFTEKLNYFQSGLSPAGSSGGGGAGVSTSATMATTVTTTFFTTGLSEFPVVLPGMLVSANTEWARPIDRVFVAYSYLDRYQVVSGPGASINAAGIVTVGPLSPRPGFDLNRYDVGIEKTFFDGRASAYVRVPFLDATSNTSGQALDGLSNITAGFKVMLRSNEATGSAFTAGMDVSAPTGHATRIVTSTTIAAQVEQMQGMVPGAIIGTPTVTLESRTVESINPTYLQPYVAGLLVRDRLFIHNFVGALISTDNRIPTLINADVTLGYQIYRGTPGRRLSSITPFVDAQALLPTSKVGSGSQAAQTFDAKADPNTPVPAGTPNVRTFASTGGGGLTFSHQVFVSPGISLGLGERALLSIGAVTPVAGPRAFSWGATVGLNFYY